MGALSARAVRGLPEITPGDDLAALILEAGDEPTDDEIIVIAQKVVSKAEGQLRELAAITPSARARELAAQLGKDERHVQAILDESSELLRAERGLLIVRTHHGFVCANAGIDTSNAPRDGLLVLLPRDPDRSARELRARFRALCGHSPAVVVSDSFGRPWRLGQLDTAIGCAGIAPLDDWRGRTDASGMQLRATWLAVADAAAGAADLARAKDSREPVVTIDGLERFVTAADGPGAASLLRPLHEDLFR